MKSPLIPGLAIGGLLLLSGPLRATTGSDSFGYEMIDSEEPGGPTMVWENIGPSSPTPGTAFPSGWNDTLVAVNFGFPFPYYGGVYSSAWISSNGAIQFGPSTSGTGANVDLPNTATPNNMIAAFWDDLIPGTGGSINYTSITTGGDPRFIVQWTTVTRPGGGVIIIGGGNGGTASLTFEIILRPTGQILFNYNAMTGTGSEGSSATVGIENSTGTVGLKYCYNAAAGTPNIIYSGLCIDFFKTQAPTPPTGLLQSTVAGGAGQPLGFVSGPSLYFRGQATDPDGNKYRLQVEGLSSSASFDPLIVTGFTATSPLVDSGLVAEASYTFTGPPFGTDSYHWRARAVDELGKASTWALFDPASVHFVEDMSAPTTVVPQSPPDGQDVTIPWAGFPLTLTCSVATDIGAAGVAGYDFEVAKDATFTQVVVAGASPDNSFATPLSTSKAFYYWRARAHDAVGNQAAWSAPSSFRVVMDDQTDNGANDGCSVGAAAGPSGWALALLAAALLGLSIRRR